MTDKEPRGLYEIYNLIVEEKATFEDYKEFVIRLGLSSLSKDGLLAMFKADRRKDLDI